MSTFTLIYHLQAQMHFTCWQKRAVVVQNDREQKFVPMSSNVLLISRARHLLCHCVIIGIMCVLLGFMHTGVHLTLIKSGNSCPVIEAKPFTGKKLNFPALKTSCVEQPGECFAECRRNSECRSFGVGKEDECSGSLLCLLYSQVKKDRNYFIRDTKYDYYILEEPNCCDELCSNNRACNSKTCKCECPKGYSANHCACPLKNISRIFHKDSYIKLPGAVMKQVASGEHTWGIREDNRLQVLVNDRWDDAIVTERFNFISSGKAGVWGLNTSNYVYVREGITTGNPFGTRWKLITGPSLIQIDSGSSGVVYGVTAANEIYCRSGITMKSPFGTGWLMVEGTAKYVSCGDYGCWVVRPDNTVAFRKGVTVNNCIGTKWAHIPGEFAQLDSGLTGNVYAITLNLTLYRMLGICVHLPYGHNHWKEVLPANLSGGYKHVTVGDFNLYVVAENGSVFKFS